MARKTVKEVKTKAYELEVVVQSHCWTTRYAERDEWDRDDTCTSHDVVGLRVAKKGSWATYTVPVGFVPEPGVEYYVVCAQYSTGDSFGRDDGRGFEVVGVYRKEEVAKENVRRIEEHDDTYTRLHGYSSNRLTKAPKGYEEYSVTLKTDDGKKHKLHTPWTGYFESLDWVRYYSFTLS